MNPFVDLWNILIDLLPYILLVERVRISRVKSFVEFSKVVSKKLHSL